jgi:SAM-dependent methyltransferase
MVCSEIGEPQRDGDWSRGGGIYWDRLPEAWLEHYPQPLWRRHSDSVNTALIERWLPLRFDSVLKTDLFDEAVSAGLYAPLAERADRVVGIDASAAIVAAARLRHSGLVAQCADVRKLPFADGEFDAVVSNSTLDHFQSPAEIVVGLRELSRVLRPGGTLVLTLDNPWNPILGVSKMLPRRALNRAWLRVGGASSRAGLLPYYVGATLSIRRLRRLLPELGLSVAETGAVVHVPRLFAVVVANLLERRGQVRSREGFLRGLMAFEHLAHWPTRFLTGHFVTVRALKPTVQESPARDR